jgi:hypothetical protein
MADDVSTMVNKVKEGGLIKWDVACLQYTEDPILQCWRHILILQNKHLLHLSCEQQPLIINPHQHITV